jgi:hypothetical protein
MASSPPLGFGRRHEPRRFAVEVGLAPAEVIAQLRAHPAMHDEHEPLPAGDGDPGFEIVKLSRGEIRLRARPQPLERSSPAVSPTMILTLRSRAEGTRVDGRFVRASSVAESAMELTRTTLVLLLVAGAFATCGLVTWPGTITTGVIVYAFVSVASLFISLRMLTSPWREGMREYGPELLGLAGEVLVPHALAKQAGNAAPFRVGELERRGAPTR